MCVCVCVCVHRAPSQMYYLLLSSSSRAFLPQIVIRSVSLKRLTQEENINILPLSSSSSFLKLYCDDQVNVDLDITNVVDTAPLEVVCSFKEVEYQDMNTLEVML